MQERTRIDNCGHHCVRPGCGGWVQCQEQVERPALLAELTALRELEAAARVLYDNEISGRTWGPRLDALEAAIAKINVLRGSAGEGDR